MTDGKVIAATIPIIPSVINTSAIVKEFNLFMHFHFHIIKLIRLL